jgi:hypothetical protein
MKRTLTIVACLAIIGVLAPSAARAQPYRLSLTLNPVSWVAGFYGFEATVPLGRAVELGGQVSMFNEAFFEATYGSSVKVTNDRPLLYPFRGGGVLRLFPFEDLSGGFVSGRAMYVQVPGETDGSDPTGEMAVGIDIGYRQLWPAGRGWGWMTHAYAGFDRIVTGDAGAPPVLPVIGFRAGIYF